MHRLTLPSKNFVVSYLCWCGLHLLNPGLPVSKFLKEPINWLYRQPYSFLKFTKVFALVLFTSFQHFDSRLLWFPVVCFSFLRLLPLSILQGQTKKYFLIPGWLSINTVKHFYSQVSEINWYIICIIEVWNCSRLDCHKNIRFSNTNQKVFQYFL